MNYIQKENNLDIWNEKKKKLAKKAMITPTKFVPGQRSIYWINFGENIGFELSDQVKDEKMHMGVVLSKNRINGRGTAIVAPITSGPCRKDKEILDCHLLLEKARYDFLNKNCVVKLDQMRCVSVERVGTKKGFIDDNDWLEIKKRIKEIFRIDIVDK